MVVQNPPFKDSERQLSILVIFFLNALYMEHLLCNTNFGYIKIFGSNPGWIIEMLRAHVK